MANLLATQNGLYFEVAQGELNYIGPADPSSNNYYLVELVRIMWGWFLSEMDDRFILQENYDNTLAAQFSDLIKAEVQLDRLPSKILFRKSA